jgi:hypothetical protein
MRVFGTGVVAHTYHPEWLPKRRRAGFSVNLGT